MAAENPTWGEERIPDELLLKLQIRLSPRTVGKYIKRLPQPRGGNDQRWSTFFRNHAHGIIACDAFGDRTLPYPYIYIHRDLQRDRPGKIRRCFHRARWVVSGFGRDLRENQRTVVAANQGHPQDGAALELWLLQPLAGRYLRPTADLTPFDAQLPMRDSLLGSKQRKLLTPHSKT
jgi:hypothetical protein